MGWEAGTGGRAGDEPGVGPRVSGIPGVDGELERDGRLAGFAPGGEWAACAPGPELAAVLAAVSGPQWRCPGAEPDEIVGVLRRWAALQSWAAAGMLGVMRQMLRDDDVPELSRARHGDLPDQWSDSVNHELALALASSVTSAENHALLAWELGARLPGIAALLADGTLTLPKARLIAETFQFLSDADAARAESLLLPQLTGTTGKTHGQLINLTARIATQVDPGMAERRRKAAEKHTSRVTVFRESTGAAGLSGRDLPPGETLAAYANVSARAREYKESGAFPDARMGQLLSAAYLDLLDGTPGWARIASGQLPGDDPGDGDDDSSPGKPGPGDSGPGRPGTDDPRPRNAGPDYSGPDVSGPDDSGSGSAGSRDPDTGGPDDTGPRVPGGDGRQVGCGCCGDCDDRCSPSDGESRDPSVRDISGDPEAPEAPEGDHLPEGDQGPEDDSPENDPSPEDSDSRGARPRLPELTFPLETLLGLAERPGEGHGFGVLDPGLCRHLAAIAAGSPHTQVCVTVTDTGGMALGHGCARRGRRPATSGAPGPPGGPPSLVALPARVNLTVSADFLSGLMIRGRPASRKATGAQPVTSFQRATDWALAPPGTRDREPGNGHDDPGWCGVWTLTLPGGAELVLRLEPVPVRECDHRHESHAYQPNATLRHLVQVRDYVCTFPSCSRHARESDFEHCRPYDKGGRTCACNAGARSRKCHRIKQSPGWKVTQLRPGWHQWRTPAGLTYVQEPYRYPC